MWNEWKLIVIGVVGWGFEMLRGGKINKKIFKGFKDGMKIVWIIVFGKEYWNGERCIFRVFLWFFYR